jgi:hypothetical protein
MDLAQICIQESATNFYQGWFPCCAIAINLLAYVYTALWRNATTRKCSSSNHHVRMLLTYHHVFYVKPGMSQTSKLWFHVLEHISNVLNI